MEITVTSELSPDLAAWWAVGAALLQAVLSAAAIVAAVLLNRHDRVERQRLEASRAVSALAAVFSRGDAALRGSYTILRDQGHSGYLAAYDGPRARKRGHTIGQCLKIISETPALSLGDWELVSALLDMEKALLDGRDALERIDTKGLARLAYPSLADAIDQEDLRFAVNLSGEAEARVHQRAHQLSSDKRARSYRIDPRVEH